MILAPGICWKLHDYDRTEIMQWRRDLPSQVHKLHGGVNDLRRGRAHIGWEDKTHTQL